MKFIKIADEIFEKAIMDINNKKRPSLFISIKDMKNGKFDIEDVLPVYDPAKRKEAGNFVSILSYKSKIDLILFISETKDTLTMAYTESDGKSALKIGVKDKNPSGIIYIKDSTWEFNAPFEQYITPWNEENRLVIEQMMKDNPPPEPMKELEMMDDILKIIMGKICQCKNCKRERGEIIESGESVYGNFDNILNKLEIPKDRDKIN
jgi:hypothetical protein